MGKEEVKTRLSGAQHWSSTEDLRKGQHRSRRSNEHKDQALMGDRDAQWGISKGQPCP